MTAYIVVLMQEKLINKVKAIVLNLCLRNIQELLRHRFRTMACISLTSLSPILERDCRIGKCGRCCRVESASTC